jgi:quercetin dioxygenase-like cupin family protein
MTSGRECHHADIGRLTDALAPDRREAGSRSSAGVFRETKNMAQAGITIQDPITGQRITFLKTSSDTGGELLRFEVRLMPGAFIPTHAHPMQHERLDLISGTLELRTRGRARSIVAGENVVVWPGQAHGARNQSDEVAIFVIEARPALRTESWLDSMFWLAREGKTNHRGRPRNALRLAVIAHEYLDEIALPGIPLVVQRAIVAPLAALGRLLGYRASISRYGGNNASPPITR